MAHGRTMAGAGRSWVGRQLPSVSLRAVLEARRARALAREVAWHDARGYPRRVEAPTRRPVPHQRWF